MQDVTIQVENLTKHYRIPKGGRTDSLREALAGGLSALLPGRRGRRGSDLVTALDGVSFTAGRGEIVGLVGRNGAGKSTLLKLLSRLTEPTSGRAMLRGRVGSLLEVGTGFHPELTGRENIYLNGAILGMRAAEIAAKLDEIVAFAEIPRFLDTPVKRYSSGMYVRLAFAVAAHLQPEILLLDEVLAVGDLRFQQKCLDHAKRLQAEAATVLFVSHNMFAVKALCSRVIYLTDGRVRRDGPAEEVIPLYEADSRLSPRDAGRGERPAGLITGIELLDAAGQPRRIFEHGERLRLRLRYRVPTPIRDANVVIAFIRSDNVACCNHASAPDGLQLPVLSGEGDIELLTPPLKLTAETYTVHVLVWDRAFRTLHGEQYGATLHIRHPLFSTHFGVFHEPAEWRWRPAGAPALAAGRNGDRP